MNYWLVKTDPDTWSWDDHVKAGTTSWEGIRNYQASNNLKAMKVGDKAFEYHSVLDRMVMGIVKVVKTYYPDPTDETGRFGMVDLKVIKPLKTPVTLKQIKAEPSLSEIALVRHSRLSVMPVTPEQWQTICEMGGVKS